MGTGARGRSKKLSKATYLAIKFAQPAPWATLRWRLVAETGWPLEYIDALDLADVQEALAVWDGEDKARK